jgi:hypothetical protein
MLVTLWPSLRARATTARPIPPVAPVMAICIVLSTVFDGVPLRRQSPVSHTSYGLLPSSSFARWSSIFMAPIV